jgi:guanylate kinase
LHFVQDKILEKKNILFDIDWQGMRSIKKQNKFNISTLFLIPPSIDVLRKRLIARGDSEEQIEKRIAGFRNDAEKACEYDYVIINDDLNKACFNVENIYNAEMQKYARYNNINYVNNVLFNEKF